MKRRDIIIFIALVLLMYFGYSRELHKEDTDGCANREAIQVTAQAFTITIENLDLLLQEGAGKLAALYKEDNLSEALKGVDLNNYEMGSDGIYHSIYGQTESTGFATGFITINDDLKNMLMATESLDEYYRACLEEYPFISQIYYNEIRSFSRVYPAFNTEGMVEPKRDLTNYNFFNKTFDGGKGSQLISRPYIDPAGSGWVISMIHPVYVEDRLKGVLGVDIKLEVLKETLLVSGGMLVLNEDGDIIILSEDMYQQIGLRVLKEYRYYSDVAQTMSLPEEYNINRSKIVGFRQMWQRIIEDNEFQGEIDFDGKRRRYCAFEVQGYGIYLLHISTR